MEGIIPYPPQRVKEYLEKGYWLNRAVGEVFDGTASRYADKEVLVSEHSRWTYSDLAGAAERLALALLEKGIRKEDRVVLLLPNCPELACLYIALAKIGAVGVWALPQHREREVGYLLGITEAAAVVVPREFRGFDYVRMARELLPDHPSLKHVIVAGEETPAGFTPLEALIRKPPKTGDPVEILKRFRPDPGEPLCLLLTGGTTAFPKIVPRTHNGMLLASRCGAEHRGHNSPDSTYLLTNHISHGAGMQRLTGCIVVNGARVVLLKRPLPQNMLEAIEKERVTHTGMVPTQALDMVSHPDFEKYDLSSLRSIDLPGARASLELLKVMKARLPHCAVHVAFGSNEGMMLSSRPGDTFEMACEGAIRPICPGDELIIIDETGRQVPDGTVGEIIARGPNIITGYYKSPELNQQAFDAEGFWHPGDLFVKNRDGTYRAMGRKDDMIIRGGENISAKEIEEALSSHPSIAGVAVVAMTDARLGQKACACVRLHPGKALTFPDMLDFLEKQHLAKYKWPERLEIFPEFPLTHIGKISKKELKADIERKLCAEAT
ncbi:MAG: AMP-binding protein [Thermodesulfobacteriota bacterium]